MGSAHALCHWLLTYEVKSRDPGPNFLAKFVSALRESTADPTLMYVEHVPEESRLVLASTWDAYFRARGLHFHQVAGSTILSIEPVFNADFIEQFCERDPKLTRIFFEDYDPVFRNAVRSVLKRRRWSSYTEEDLVTEVWTDFLSRCRYILEHYDSSRGSQRSWLFHVAFNTAQSRLRSEFAKQYFRNRGGLELRYELHDNLELSKLLDEDRRTVGPSSDPERVDLSRFFTLFKEWLEKNRPRSQVMTWEFFLDSFVHEMSTEELVKKYGISINTVHIRRYRLRQEFRAMWEAVHSPDSLADPVVRSFLSMGTPIELRDHTNQTGQQRGLSVLFKEEAHLILDVQIEDLDQQTIDSILIVLRTVSKDPDLSIRRIRRGSAILVLDATSQALQALEEKINSGQVTQIHGVPIRRFLRVSHTPDSLSDTLPRSPSEASKARKLFYSYATKDIRYLEELITHLTPLKKQGLLHDWDRRKVRTEATAWDETSTILECSDFILLLVSPDYLREEICGREVAHALRQCDGGACRLVPIRLRPVSWSLVPFSEIKPLPKGKKSIVEWKLRDLAWMEIVEAIHPLIIGKSTRAVSQKT